MSETPPEAPEPQLPANPDTPEAEDPELHAAPEDIAEADSKGFAVYNRTLGQYVPGVEKKKPTTKAANERVPEGHTAAIVRV